MPSLMSIYLCMEGNVRSFGKHSNAFLSVCLILARYLFTRVVSPIFASILYPGGAYFCFHCLLVIDRERGGAVGGIAGNEDELGGDEWIRDRKKMQVQTKGACAGGDDCGSEEIQMFKLSQP
jgi:hypothetical protein